MHKALCSSPALGGIKKRMHLSPTKIYIDKKNLCSNNGDAPTHEASRASAAVGGMSKGSSQIFPMKVLLTVRTSSQVTGDAAPAILWTAPFFPHQLQKVTHKEVPVDSSTNAPIFWVGKRKHKVNLFCHTVASDQVRATYKTWVMPKSPLHTASQVFVSLPASSLQS